LGLPGKLSKLGRIAEQDLLRIPTYHPGSRIDKYVIMPNHIHVILVIENPSAIHSISQIIALYKTGVTKQIRGLYPNLQVWQRSFYDHIIRNQRSYEEIWTYIDDNPQKWEADKFYVDLGRVENPPLQE
jgi:REP element-mobilizing transposase RayT